MTNANLTTKETALLAVIPTNFTWVELIETELAGRARGAVITSLAKKGLVEATEHEGVRVVRLARTEAEAPTPVVYELPAFSAKVYEALRVALYAEPGFTDVTATDLAKAVGAKPVAVNAAIGHLISVGLAFTCDTDVNGKPYTFINTNEHCDEVPVTIVALPETTTPVAQVKTPKEAKKEATRNIKGMRRDEIGVTAGNCLCGCGLLAAKMFRQGHDAKLKGQIRTAQKAGQNPCDVVNADGMAYAQVAWAPMFA